MHAGGGEMTQVEILVLSALGQHLAENGAGNDIARSKFGQGMIFRHETLSRVVAQISPFAAHSLRDQVRTTTGRQYGRVELHEFEIGQGGSGVPRQGQAIGGRSRRIRSVQPEATRASIGQDRGLCMNNEGLT